MRIALHVEAELGVRTGRVLLAEAEVEVGLFDDDATNLRVQQVDAITDWDVLLVDELTITSRVIVEQAMEAGLPVVLGEERPAFDDSPSPMVVGAKTGARLAMALAESQRDLDVMEAQLAWTESGTPLGDGVAVTFPDPVGALWADTADVPDGSMPARGLVAPTKGDFRAVVARVTCATDSGVEQRILGVADDAKFMDAVAMGAAGLTAAKGGYKPGIGGPGDTDGIFLRQLEESGLHIARFTPAS